MKKKRAKPVSLDQPIPVGSNNKLTLQNLIPNNNNKDTDDSVNSNILNTILMQSINCLNEREKAVITQLYGINGTSLTMAEVATSFGLKRERVRQIRNTALRKLYRKMR